VFVILFSTYWGYLETELLMDFTLMFAT
jgi:hypothetical protein